MPLVVGPGFRPRRSFPELAALAAFAMGVGVTASAPAAVTEPDGQLVVPIDARQSPDLACCSNTLNNMSLDALFKSRGERIDYQRDATTEPASFSPLCGLSGAMVLHGGGCKVDFGWYCTSDADPPAIHPLVTAEEVVTYHDGPATPPIWRNGDKAFVPKVGQVVNGTPLGNLRDLPEFQSCTSQKIGFAVRPSPAYPNEVCTMPKYSEQARNQVCTLPACGGRSWISAVVYASTVLPGAFYVAIEDLPTLPDNFKAPVPGKGWTADGDFNDFVYLIQGITCDGGGQPCTPVVDGVALKGVCASGVTACSPAADQPGTCQARALPSPEKCDNLDNNCNGIVDEGDALCPDGQVCDHGTCVKVCGHGEFVCPGDRACETTGALAGYCVEPACKGVVCGEGQVCRKGVCAGGCEGVTCPDSQECILGSCIDPCKDVSCPGDFVCNRGVCVSSCRCMGCPGGQACGANGTCSDTRCAGVACAPGMVCRQGTCADPCAGVTCPGGGQCVVSGDQVSCTAPAGGSGGSGVDAGAVDLSGFGGGGGGGGSERAAGGTSDRPSPSPSGCSCRVTTLQRGNMGWASLLGAALVAVLARRATRTRRPSRRRQSATHWRPGARP